MNLTLFLAGGARGFFGLPPKIKPRERDLSVGTRHEQSGEERSRPARSAGETSENGSGELIASVPFVGSNAIGMAEGAESRSRVGAAAAGQGLWLINCPRPHRRFVGRKDHTLFYVASDVT